MFATILRHTHAFYYEVQYENGTRNLAALSSPLIEQHGQHCDKAFKAGDRVKLLLVRRHDYPSIIGAA